MLLLAFGHWPALAAEQTGPATPSVNQQVLESRIKEVEATAGLDEATKVRLTELYRRALTNLEKWHSYRADSATFEQAQTSAPADAEKLRNTLAKKQRVAPETSLRLSDKTPLSELEQRLQQEKADLAAVEAKLSDLNKRLEAQAGRPSTVRERLIAARRQQESVVAELKTPAPEGELAALTQARHWALETQAQALSAEIKMLDRELLSRPARLQLLEAQQEIAAHNVRFVAARVRVLEDTLSKRRLAEAEQVQQEAQAVKEALKEKHPLVHALAARNVALGEELKSRALELERVSAEDDAARAQAKRISGDLSTVRAKLEVAGLSQALGQVLREQQRALPQLTDLQREARERERHIADAGLRQIQYGEERRRLRDLDTYVADLSRDLDQDEANAIRDELHQLATNRRELLDKAIATEASYLRNLGELDLARLQLIDVVGAYHEFLGKRLLWIQSTKPVSPALFKDLPAELAGLLSPSSWLRTGQDMLRRLADSLAATLLLIGMTGLIFMRRRCLAKVRAAGEKIGRIRTDSYTYTWQALGWTALASAPLPLLLMAAAWQLSLAPEAAAFSTAVGVGLKQLGLDLLFLLFFADLAIAGGVLAKHLRWPSAAVAKLRREVRWLMMLFLPSVFIVRHSLDLDSIPFGGGLVTLVGLIGIGAIGLFVYRSFTPRGGVLADFIAQHPGSLLARWRPIWIGLILAYIIGLMGLVLGGYLHTVITLTRDLINTVWLIVALLLVRGLVVRWLLLVRRRLAFQAALERREEARAAREAAEQADGRPTAGGDDSVEIEEPEVDLGALDAASRKLINTALVFAGVIGLWLIWAPLLPALAILEDVSLWGRTAMVDGVETVTPVTLADLALALIVGTVTIAAARGLPALLEFMLLQRISITAGDRYTATTLLRYAIVGIGTVIFFSVVGADWSKIQWLVAALGVGIGFGLQEIVANFISGLIILFERPIRVGDTVTVGDTSGVVTRIQIRATTITNWDRQELLVPNKEFITTRLLNWSLSDPIIRVRIPVGVAYGSDVAKAMILMKDAAEEHDNVLDDPRPSVTFESFGDNSLQLYLRAFLPSLEHRIETITELHKAINLKFNKAGIVIAFPQRDVHLDTTQPLDVRLHRGDRNSGDAK